MAYQETRIHGLVNGIEYRQHERTDQLNQRIEQRFQSDQPLQPLYDPRPSMTKYSVFPIVDLRTPPKTQLKSYLDYSTTNTFAPMQSNAPVDGYFRNIQVEMDLRNQYFALSSANQRYFVPSSNSDLYRNRSVSGPLNELQPYPRLFSKSTFDSSPHPNLDSNIGNLTFFNDTRFQLRGPGSSTH